MLATETARPSTSPPPTPQPSAMPSAMPSERRDEGLADGPRDGDAPHGEQVPEREVDADAEHQQDHADLGELGGDRGVGDEARA